MSEPTTPDEGCGDPTEPDDDVADVLVTSARVVAALRADLAAANARLAAAPSRDVPCVTCGHSIMVHQSNEAGGPCGQCDCEDGALLVNPPKL